MPAKDSLTLKTYIVETFQKSTKHNHQYLRVPDEPEEYLDFRGHPNMAASVEISAMDSLTSKT